MRVHTDNAADLRDRLCQFRVTIDSGNIEETMMTNVSRRFATVAVVVALSMVALPKLARADWVITPYVGANYGGSTSNNDLGDAVNDSSKLTYGVSFGWMSKGIIGFEEDFAYTDKFFAPVAGIDQTNLLTLMSNVIVGIPFGGQKGFGVRPFAVGGVGLMRTNVDNALNFVTLDNNSFGWDAGGGVDIYFWHIGIRGDARYFRDFSTPDVNSPLGFILQSGKLNFWRSTAGVVFRF
jgi:hypothetical protein